MSQLLTTLGITREDLSKRSDQMRQFLTSETSPTPRAANHDGSRKPHPIPDSRPNSTAGSSKDSSSSSLSRTRTNSLRESTPPVIASVKAEPSDGAIPPRSYTTMDMVIERQRRQNRKEKKNRRDKERETSLRPTLPPAPPSPSPKPSSQASVCLDSFMRSRDDMKAESADGNESGESDDILPIVQAPLPVTPQKNSYYREHTRDSTVRKRKPTARDESPTPTRLRVHPPPQANPCAHFVPFSHYLPIPVQNPQASTSALPVTPKRPQAASRRAAKPPLPLSSSPPPSSPVSSPSRPIINLVSSPGPMGPEPNEEEYDALPFALPPGPYSPSKPEQSYAALVGQAILSSPEHRLTLQEIYDWITIVYPYFKRGETTWMNSIRHVLSTTIVFRKVTRDRSLGRTHWAIWDEDRECFKGGGFKKQLCKDYVNATKEKRGTGSRSRTRKRDESDDTGDGRKTKRRKERDSSIQPIFPLAPLIAHPLFPPTRPSVHHQPYYESCLPQTQPVPADLIFPPLPPAAALSRVINGDQPTIKLEDTTASTMIPSSSPEQHPLAPPPTSEAISPVPDLTPQASSSSPPMVVTPESLPTGENVSSQPKEDHGVMDGIDPSSLSLPQAPEPESIMPKPGSLLRLHPHSPDEGTSKDKGKRKDKGKNKVLLFPPLPPSPTLGRKTLGTRITKGSTSSVKVERAKTPSPILVAPSTPPRKKRALESSNGSPIAAKGSSVAEELTLTMINQTGSDVFGTPSRRNSLVLGGSPVTPKRAFSNSVSESPFRTPLGMYEGSPFRTPGSRLIFDPHDPRTLLDDELNRLSSAQGESPGGLYGKGVGTLLYDSPGVESPGKWTRWW
ncbi:hypothetical protein BDN72DRAFT_895474 [Pluteus cervinus]|uniref:Uncharacterized protein n=1 Tax=Pluteus cervinus TaxID=181527 RepID=A0ACD3B217_9AGAR|nr:hypothetical protein BDN72DRAFT_895474 [Pluteus cervinus]